MNNRIIAHYAFLETAYWTLGLEAIYPTAKHYRPKCSNKQWDDASLLACSALKGFPCDVVLKAKDLQSAWNGNGQNFLIKLHQNQF